LDISAGIGGLNAFVKPLAGFFSPLIVIQFLVGLSKIIKEKYAQEYKEELTKFISYAMKKIQKQYGNK